MGAAIILFIIIAATIFTCATRSENSSLKKDLKSAVEAREKSEKRVELHHRYIGELEDSIKTIHKKKEAVYAQRESQRKAISKEVEKAKSVSEVEADSLLKERFGSSKETLIYIAESDSIRLELRSLVDLYNLEVKENIANSEINKHQKNIIVEKDIQLAKADEIIGLKDLAIKQEKRKKPRIFGWGVVAGVGLAAGTYILIK